MEKISDKLTVAASLIAKLQIRETKKKVKIVDLHWMKKCSAFCCTKKVLSVILLTQLFILPCVNILESEVHEVSITLVTHLLQISLTNFKYTC